MPVQGAEVQKSLSQAVLDAGQEDTVLFDHSPGLGEGNSGPGMVQGLEVKSCPFGYNPWYPDRSSQMVGELLADVKKQKEHNLDLW